MTTYFTSDTHFGHKNIIKYCNRPFADVDEMNKALIDNWNDVVRPSDEVYHLGDVSLGQIKDTLPLAKQLHGHKFLVRGNHDRCWQNADWMAAYQDVGFKICQDSLHFDDFVVCHFPYTGDSQADDRYVSDRPVDEGKWLLHGHVHDEWKIKDRLINVGVDVWDYHPVSYDVLNEIRSSGNV